MKSALLAALAVAGLSTTAVAQEQGDAKPKTAKKADTGKRVCRADVNTGSRMARKTCRTEAEWAEISRQNAEAASSALQAQSSGR